MRTLGIVGSREWDDWDSFFDLVGDEELSRPFDRIVSGGARGVDSMAARYARDFKKNFDEYPPDPKLPFVQAAHERNQHIVDESDFLIAMPGPNSKGTWDTVRRAAKKGITILIIPAPK